MTKHVVYHGIFILLFLFLSSVMLKNNLKSKVGIPWLIYCACKMVQSWEISIHVFRNLVSFSFRPLHPTVAEFALFTMTVCWLRHPGLSLSAPQIISHLVTTEMAILQLAALIMLNVQGTLCCMHKAFSEKLKHKASTIALLSSSHKGFSCNSASS